MSRFKHHNRFSKIEGSGYCYVQPDTKLWFWSIAIFLDI